LAHGIACARGGAAGALRGSDGSVDVFLETSALSVEPLEYTVPLAKARRHRRPKRVPSEQA